MNSKVLHGYTCFKCNKQFSLHTTLITHIKISHPFITEYRCKQLNCFRSYKDLNGLRKHFKVKHNHGNKETFLNTDMETNQHSLLNPSNFLSDGQYLESCSLNAYTDRANTNSDANESCRPPIVTQNINSFIAAFIGRLYSNCSLNRSIVQSVLENTKSLIDQVFTLVLKDLEKHVTKEEISTIFKNILQHFDNLNSEYLRFKQLEHINSFIKPKPYQIGVTTSLRQIDTPGQATMAVRKVQGQIICIRTILKKFLEIPNVFTKIEVFIQEQESITSEITSIYQGELWKNLKKSFQNKKVFPIYLFCDDFEPVNPLGSRAGIYKIGAVYLSLACMPFEFASLLENIFLAQLFYSCDRNMYGNQKIFNKLIEELIHLEQEGISIILPDGKEQRIFFTLFLILGDNLGLNSVLGFTESFNSENFCRICLTTKLESQTETNESLFIYRNELNYNLDSTHKSHGVKEPCIWNLLPNFHVTRNVSCDLMHDLLEGVLRYDMAFIINNLIKRKYFSLNLLNDRIKFFKFSKADSGNLMPQIKSEHLKRNHLIMSASEMLSLIIYFSFLVGDLVSQNEPIWKFYVITLQIVEILLGRTFTKDLILYLNVLIEEHHSMFKDLFQEHLRPKYHILLHYPKIIKSLGPPRHYWGMRFEGFHKLLKATANSTTCRKNLLVTLSIKQQLRLSYRFSSNKGLEYEMKTGPCSTLNKDIKILRLNFSKEALSVPWLSNNYNFYKIGFFLSTGNFNETDGIVTFSQIESIIIDKDSIYFLLISYETLGFSSHFQAYEVRKMSSNTLFISPFDSLKNRNVYNAHFLGNGSCFISMIK